MTNDTLTPEQIEAARLDEIARADEANRLAEADEAIRFAEVAMRAKASKQVHDAANARAARILARPAHVKECVDTALDIASAELVNLRAASEYLQGSYPDYFKSVNEAEEAILDADEATA